MSFFRSLFLSGSIALGLVVAGGAAQAALVKINGPLANGAFAGNDSDALINSIIDPNGLLPDVSKIAKFEEGTPADFFENGVNPGFTVNVSGDNKTGTWSFTDPAGDPDIVVTHFVVKGSNSFLLFDVNPDEDGTGASYQWSTLGLLTGGGRQPGYSHLTWYGYTVSTSVPEPGALALLGLGLLGLGFLVRRRKSA